jgi:protein-tyrosine phosphatase
MLTVPFAILFVCTGNVCRSPMAELLCREWADPNADVEVSSAGMSALVGEGIDRATALVLGEIGIDAGRHRARQFEPAFAEPADLILTAETVHRDKIISVAPTAWRRVFTMKEFARLARHASQTEPGAIVAELSWVRGADGALPNGVDDLTDPYRGTVEQAREVAAELTVVVQTVLNTLGVGRAAPRHDPAPIAPTAAPRPRPRPRPG